MSFVARLLERCRARRDRVLLQEVHADDLVTCRGEELLSTVEAYRAFLRASGLEPGDRCAIVAPNSIDWVAADLAILAEGILPVPLYARQTVPELVAALRDCTPSLVLCGDEGLASAIRSAWSDASPVHALSSVAEAKVPYEVPPAAGHAEIRSPAPHGDPSRPSSDHPLAIFYTSGSSGEPKGVVLSEGNVSFSVECASRRLDELMSRAADEERVLHYLPFCFAGSWIMLLVCLARGVTLTINTDPSRLIDDVRGARPHYFQNVPLVLERIRQGVEQGIERRGGAARQLFARALRALRARSDGERPSWADAFSRAMVRRFFLPSVRSRLGPELRALICGSALLSRETQLFFELLGIPVLQVYGLTESTAILTMDRPGETLAGCVGRAVEGVEMRVAEDGEILARGPNVFDGYWNRPEASRAALADGWLRTGDLGEETASGHWRIFGRKKDTLVPMSGHKIAPEPIEERLRLLLPEARQIMLAGTGRPHLVAIVTGSTPAERVASTLDTLNDSLAHFERIRTALIVPQPFTMESGLLTANGKLRRERVLERFGNELDELYRRAAGVSPVSFAAEPQPTPPAANESSIA
jgi:long-chain acyl-CoA synthetase